MTGASALAATAILLGLACLQAQLVVGRPLGRFAWGVAHEVLPPGLRVASTLSIVLYGAIALVLLDAADVVDALGDAGQPPLPGCLPGSSCSSPR